MQRYTPGGGIVEMSSIGYTNTIPVLSGVRIALMNKTLFAETKIGKDSLILPDGGNFAATVRPHHAGSCGRLQNLQVPPTDRNTEISDRMSNRKAFPAELSIL